jgi:hypothetical protein
MKNEATKSRRRVERKIRAENDPYFGRRRAAGEMGNKKSKAAVNRNACRGKVSY